jgi:D-glycero-beta-D-manno-heptose-7-phosphate kinase
VHPVAENIKKRVNRAKLLVVGDAMLDKYWFGEVERISPEAPIPIVRVAREEYRLGGAANVALNAKKLGADVSLMTIAGRDQAAETLEGLLTDAGVNATVLKDTQMQTIVKLRIIGRSQQLLRLDFENKPTAQALDELTGSFTELVSAHDTVIFSDYGKGALDLVQLLIPLARRAGKPALVDPKGSDYDRYAQSTVITPNRSELAQVIGSWENEPLLRTKAEELRARLRLDALLLTRSEEGMTLFEEQNVTNIATNAKEVFDITGAGDTVIATLAVLLAIGTPMQEAVVIANRAAGLVVGKFGTAHVSFDELF